MSLDERIATACGHLNACYAELVELLGEVIATGAWAGHGIRSVERWIGWRTGLSGCHCRTLAALVAARASHPRIVEAFAAGELSIDQAGWRSKPAPTTTRMSPDGPVDDVVAVAGRGPRLQRVRRRTRRRRKRAAAAECEPTTHPNRRHPKRGPVCASICRCSRMRMGRGGCTAVSTVTTGHSSTLLCPRPGPAGP